MVRFKKFIFIPVLIFVYIYFINSILVPNISYMGVEPLNVTGGEGQAIRIGTSVSVFQTRLYFLKLIRLPVQIDGINMDGMHNLFFFIIYCLIIFFVILEIVSWKYSYKKQTKNDFYGSSKR